MKRRMFATTAAVLISMTTLVVLLCILGRTSPGVSNPALAAPMQITPTVALVDPSSAPNDSDNPIAISGADFAAVLSGTEVITPPTVYLDSTSLGGASWVSTTTLTITVPVAFPVGVYTVTVVNPDGESGSLPNGLTVRYPAPVLQSLTPVSGTYGQAAMLVITGTGLVATPTIALGEIPCSVGYVSSTTLTTTVPSSLLPGVHGLTVCNPGPGNPCDTLPGAFTLYSPVPTVLAVSPDSAPNDLDVQVVITGTGFAPTPTVALGSIPLQNVTWVSSTQLAALVPWGMDEGTYNLTVTNPSPGAASDVLSGAFTVTQGIGVCNATNLYGGSVEQVAIHPSTSTLLYASTGAGLFRSYDSAENWASKLGPAKRNLAFDALSPRRVYAEGDPHDGGFLWRSNNEGDTWDPITTTFPITQTSGRKCWVRHQIRVVSETLYVAACGADGGPSGLITSTDHGETWTPATVGLTDTQVTALTFHPTDLMTMYLGTASGNVFISHNGGYSWTFASRPVSCVHDLDVNPFGAHDVWISAGNMLGDPCGLYKSDNTELNAWSPVGEPHEWCSADVIFAPETWSVVVSGTVFLASEGVGFKTTDGGDTFYPFGPEGWIHDIALHPTDPSTIFVGEGGWGDGFYKTTDGGASWQIANQGMTAVVPDLLSIVPGQPDIAYALSLGKVYRSTQGGRIWKRLPISGVVTILLDPITPTRIYAGVSDGIFISENGGQTWPTHVPITRPVAYTDCGMWVNVLSPVPDQPGTLLAAARHFGWTANCVNAHGSLYRSANFGQDWYRIDLSQEISQVNDIVYDPISPAVMYAAIGNDDETGGNILKSSNGGASWAPLEVWSINGVPFDLEMEPGTHRIFANVNGRLPLYVSEDGGVTWTPTAFGGGHSVNDILFAPGASPVLYDAAAQGLYRSTDGAQTWKQAAGVLGQVPIYSLAVATATDRVILYAGTTGGYVQSDASRLLDTASSDGTLVNAGVYRYTTRLPTERAYLPVVLRAYEQQLSLQTPVRSLSSRSISKVGSSCPNSRPHNNVGTRSALGTVLISGVLMFVASSAIMVSLHRPARAGDAGG
jgi:photosystem II stability/assembly factor-like uncharacterized protein